MNKYGNTFFYIFVTLFGIKKGKYVITKFVRTKLVRKKIVKKIC